MLKTIIKIFPALLGLLIITEVHGARLTANVATVVLTPPLDMGYTLGGYGARMSKPARGVHDDIRAKALVLKEGRKKYAIVTLDILGLPPNVKPQVIEMLNDTTWREENLLFLPSHSHTSLEMFALNDKNIFKNPAIGIFQPALLDFVVNKLAEVIKLADRDHQPVSAGTGSLKLKDLNRNRRDLPFVDNELTVTRIDNINGKTLAVLVNWTAHPTIMDEHDMCVSGGWPGYLQRELEGCIGNGAIAMFYNGAEGDQSVVTRGTAGSHYEKAEIYGRTIAVKALEVYREIQPKEEVTFRYNFTLIRLPKKTAHPDFMLTGGKEYGLDEEKIDVLLNQVLPEKTSLSAVRIGDLLIAGVPGELTAELGLKVKNTLNKAGIRHPVIGGLANQWISYILSEKEYERGGYESSASFYGKDLGKVITRALVNTSRPLIK